MNHSNSTTLSAEQLARMEKNKLDALDKKRRAKYHSTSSNVLSESSNNVANITENSLATVSSSKKARILPNWSNVPSIPCLLYPDDIIYCTTTTHAITIVQRFQQEQRIANSLTTSRGQFTVGFDIEWRVTFEKDVAPRKVATVQICSPNMCAVFQISNFGEFYFLLVFLLFIFIEVNLTFFFFLNSYTNTQKRFLII